VLTSHTGISLPPSLKVPPNKPKAGKDPSTSSYSSAAAKHPSTPSSVVSAVIDEKRHFLFYPIVSYDNSDFNYLNSDSKEGKSSMKGERGDRGDRGGDKKKRRDIDHLLSNVITSLASLSSDLIHHHHHHHGTNAFTGSATPSPIASTANHIYNSFQIKIVSDYSSIVSSSSTSTAAAAAAASHYVYYDKQRNLRIIKLILGIEMTSTIIRSINTMLMNPKIILSNNIQFFKNELQNNHFLILHDINNNSKKMIKQYLSNLIILANQLMNLSSSSSSSSSTSSSVGSSSTSSSVSSSGHSNKGGGNAGDSHHNSSGNSNYNSSGAGGGNNGKYLVYVYSLIDDSFDLLTFIPESFLQLKSVL
jgi:hypothetical protein